MAEPILDSYVEVIADLANDDGYEEGALESLLSQLLVRMWELIQVWGLEPPVIDEDTRERLIDMGLEEDLNSLFQ